MIEKINNRIIKKFLWRVSKELVDDRSLGWVKNELILKLNNRGYRLVGYPRTHYQYDYPGELFITFRAYYVGKKKAKILEKLILNQENYQ